MTEARRRSGASRDSFALSFDAPGSLLAHLGNSGDSMGRPSRTFMPHQRAAFRWAKHRKAVAFFMEMRLGKSMPAIRWASTRPNCNRILIVTELPAVPDWKRELLAVEGLEPVDLTGHLAKRLKSLQEGQDERWFIINYEGLTERGHKTSAGNPKAVPSVFATIPWDCVLYDESPKIRSPRAQITKVSLDYVSQTPYRALLSGLPNPESEEDFICQMLFLENPFMGCRDYWEWRAKHMQASQFDWIIKRKSLKELKVAVKRRSFFMTRREAGMGETKVRETRYVELPAKVVKAMATAEKDFEVGDKLAMNALQVMTWLSQLAGGRYPHDDKLQHDGKFKEIVRLLKGDLKKEPVLVLGRYTAELDAMMEHLEKAKISAKFIGGKTRKTNAATIKAFQAGRCRVLVCQTKSIQKGIDLSRSSTLIYLSNYYDFEVRSQSEDRIVHPTKSLRETLLIIDVISKGSIDEEVIHALRMKKANAGSFNRKFIAKFLARLEANRASAA